MASLLRMFSGRIKDRQNQRVQRNMEHNGFEQQNQQLINQGFTDPKQNFKALSQANGNVQAAIQFLVQKQQIQQQKSDIKQQRSQLQGNYLQEKRNLKMVSKQQKYEAKLLQLQPIIQQNNLGPSIQHICSLGYDNQVKVVKVLLKKNGNLNDTIKHIQKKSSWNKNKFKLIKQDDQSSNMPQQNQSQNYQNAFQNQQNIIQNSFQNQNAPSNYQQNFYVQQQQVNFAPYNQQLQQQQINYNYPPLPQEQLSGQQGFNSKQVEQYYTYNPQNSQLQNQQSQLQQNLLQNQMKSQNSQVPEPPIDTDAMKQMISQKQEEMKNNNNQQNNQKAKVEIKDEDVEQYIKKNQFLIAQGFKKAQKNIKVLIQCNGDENQALQALQQLNQIKMQDKLNKNSKPYQQDQSSSSSSSDSD